MADELSDLDLVEQQLGRTGVDPADLEQVVDHALEPAHLDVEKLEGTPAPRVQVRPMRVEHPEGVRKSRERRPQLVAHVRGEACLVADPFLQSVGHAVERAGERREVGVSHSFEARVETTAGDRLSGLRDAHERKEYAACGESPDGGTGNGRNESNCRRARGRAGAALSPGPRARTPRSTEPGR